MSPPRRSRADYSPGRKEDRRERDYDRHDRTRSPVDDREREPRDREDRDVKDREDREGTREGTREREPLPEREEQHENGANGEDSKGRLHINSPKHTIFPNISDSFQMLLHHPSTMTLTLPWSRRHPPSLSCFYHH